MAVSDASVVFGVLNVFAVTGHAIRPAHMCRETLVALIMAIISDSARSESYLTQLEAELDVRDLRDLLDALRRRTRHGAEAVHGSDVSGPSDDALVSVVIDPDRIRAIRDYFSRRGEHVESGGAGLRTAALVSDSVAIRAM